MSSLTALTLSQTITFLTTPLLLSGAYNQQQLHTLKQILGISFSSSVLRSSGTKPTTLTLSPETLPPRPIYAACIASGIRWVDWIALLGGREFDLIVDTTKGCLSIRLPGSPSQMIWSTATERKGAMEKLRRGHSKRLSLSLTEEEIKIVISAPTPTKEEMDRPASPESTVSDDSEAESEFSLYTASDSSASSADSRSSSPVQCERPAVYIPPKRAPSSPIRVTKPNKASPQVPRSTQAVPKPFVDESKTSVTPYDGGKVGVLTGGVMLGGRGPRLSDTKTKAKHNGPAPRSWRKM
jgi:hypothetical protein